MESKPLINLDYEQELLKRIQSGCNTVEAFIELYKLRQHWVLSPYVHDGLITRTAFDDIQIPEHVKISLIPTIIDLTLSEPPEHLHYNLFFLQEIIPDNKINDRPKCFGEKLLKLRDVVEKFSFIPNITSTWETLVTKSRCLKPTEYDLSYEYSPKQLSISSDAFLKHFPIPLPKVDGKEVDTCPVSLERILEEGNKTCFAGVTCLFEQFAEIRNSKWWIFRCKPNEPNFIWIGYVYVRQDQNQLIEIGHWSSHRRPMSACGLHAELLKREFSQLHSKPTAKST